MQVSIQTTSGLERKLTVGIPAERVDSEVNNRLQKAAGNVKLDGFRPGKVPMKVMKQRFGAGIRQEVLQEVMNQSFSEAIVQENLKPAGMPDIEPKNMEAGSDLEYVATFEVFPEVEAKSFGDVVIDKPVAIVTEADIDTMIETLRKQQATWEVAERAAISGDKVNLDYAAGQGQSRFNDDFGRKDELAELVSGRRSKKTEEEGATSGTYHTLPDELKRSLIATAKKFAKRNRKRWICDFIG